MSAALLHQLYRELPQFHPHDDPDLWAARIHESIRAFRRKVSKYYSEGTLQRLLTSPSVETRRAAVFTLGLLGTMESNGLLARMLHDEDTLVAKMACDSIWDLWFRGSSEENNLELQRLIHLNDFQEIIAGLDQLIREAPDFAEVYNQRAILYFRRGEYVRSIHDCEKVLQLNPVHFGAQSGMGQCFMKLRKPKSALRAFRSALALNPTLTHLEETIGALENVLDEE